jgi:glycine dehydrogenase subunit 1
MGAMHMSLLGPEGVRSLAVRNAAALHAVVRALEDVEGVEHVHPDGHHFNEIAVRLPGPASACIEALEDHGVLPGFDLGRWSPDRANQLLVTATDQTRPEDIERLATALQVWCAEVVA